MHLPFQKAKYDEIWEKQSSPKQTYEWIKENVDQFLLT